MDLSLDLYLDLHQHSNSLLCVEVTLIIISSLESVWALETPCTKPWPVCLDVCGSLVGQVQREALKG